MSLLDRIAGAPITWGVDGSPGWGYLMDPDRVLGEMAAIGLTATELGPDGYLGSTPEEVSERVRRHGLRLVAGFIPVVLYRPDRLDAEIARFDRAVATLVAGGADVAVLGPASDLPGYDTPVELTAPEWSVFFTGLSRLMEVAAAHGVTVALHQHWGMAVQRPEDVERVLESSSVGLCIDTGHLALAGADPVKVAEVAAGRVDHVHLKDLDAAAAERVRSGEVPFRQAVVDGLFRPLGRGDVDIAGLIRVLEAQGYRGWYVLEQDTALDGEPPSGKGPIEDALISVEFLRALAGEPPPPADRGRTAATAEKGPVTGARPMRRSR